MAMGMSRNLGKQTGTATRVMGRYRSVLGPTVQQAADQKLPPGSQHEPHTHRHRTDRTGGALIRHLLKIIKGTLTRTWLSSTQNVQIHFSL